MRRWFTCLSLLSLLLIITSGLLGQTRPRRVGQDSSSTQTPGPTSPPGRAPVLSGSNYPNNRPPEKQTSTPNTDPEEVEAGDVIRVNTTLITLPVSVMDRDGRYVPNLQKEDFRIWEDDVEQQVAFFSSVDKPFSVVLMLDMSPSTQFRMEDIQDAAITFVNQLRPDDRVMVVSFNDDIKVLTDFTTDRDRMRNAILRTHTDDGTRLYDAVDLVMNQKLGRVEGRKAVVLFTDGVDTTSKRATYESTVQDAEELDALIYPVQYNTYRDMGGGVWPGNSSGDVWGQILGGIFGGPGGMRRGGRRGGAGTSRGEYALAGRYLTELAQRTGARQYEADTNQNLSYAFSNIADELRRQYSVGFYPKNPPQPGQRRQIRVRVNQPNLAVRSRDSYVFNPVGATNSPQDASTQKPPVLRKLAESTGNKPTSSH